MKKNRVRMIIDITMTVLLPLLMAYSLIGEMFHEIAGTAIFVLFIAHNILNRKWYKVLFKGKYNARRIFQTVLNLTLLIFMILQPVSGILMSKHLYTFLPAFSVSAFARSLHLILAYWGYVLLCIHDLKTQKEKNPIGSVLRFCYSNFSIRCLRIHKTRISGVYVGKDDVCLL